MASLSDTCESPAEPKRPFRSLGQASTVGILQTADHVRRALSSVVEPHGITLQQYNVLRILRGAGESLPTLEVARRMVEQTPGVTRLLDRLEAKDLASRTRCPRDRRQVLLEITDEGRELLTRLDMAMDEADEAAVSSLTPGEQRQLLDLLDRIRADAPTTAEGSCP